MVAEEILFQILCRMSARLVLEQDIENSGTDKGGTAYRVSPRTGGEQSSLLQS